MKKFVAVLFCLFASGAVAQEGGGPGSQPPPRPIAPLQAQNGKLSLLYGNGLNLSGGTLVLGPPTATVLGGIYSAAAPANQFQTGNNAGVPTFRQPSFADLLGSLTATQMPALTGDVSAPAGSTATTIGPGAVTAGKMAVGAAYGNLATNGLDYTKLSQAPASTFSGNPTGATANRQDMAPSAATGLLLPCQGDTGSGGTKGLVPAPPAGAAAAGQFLAADCTFKAPVISGASCPLFAGVADGVTDNAPLLNATLASASFKGCLAFGDGRYSFGSGITYNVPAGKPSFTLVGNGSSTELYWPGSNGGITINAYSQKSSFHIRNFAMVTAAVNSGSAIKVVSSGNLFSAPSEIDNVYLHGADINPGTTAGGGTGGSQCWAYGVNIHDWGNVLLNNVQSFGTWGAVGSAGCGIGLLIEGDTPSQTYATVINIQASSFNLHQYGTVLADYWQGVTFNQVNFNGAEGGAGIIVPSSANKGQLALLSIFNSQFNTWGPQIVMFAPIFTAVFIGNTISCTSNGCVGISQSGAGLDLQVIGNHFNVYASPGTNVTGVASVVNNGVITGNVFTDMSVGFNLQSGSSNFKTMSNAFRNVTTSYLNNGSGNSVGVATP